MFLKKSNKRTQEEKDHFNRIIKENEQFLRLEVIKEAMHEFFHARSEDNAKIIFDNIGDWIWQAGFKPLMKWHDNLETQWKTLTANYSLSFLILKLPLCILLILLSFYIFIDFLQKGPLIY